MGVPYGADVGVLNAWVPYGGGGVGVLDMGGPITWVPYGGDVGVPDMWVPLGVMGGSMGGGMVTWGSRTPESPVGVYGGPGRLCPPGAVGGGYLGGAGSFPS